MNTDRKDKLERLKREFDEFVIEMQTQKSRAAAAAVGKATSKELGKVAAQYRKNETR